MGKASETEGRWAEERAAVYLMQKGCRILEKRYRCRWGEIDLVYLDSGYLVFGEVKYRRSLTYGAPEESVTAGKQMKLMQCARYYISEKGTEDLPCRFDVIAMWKDGDRLKVRHIKNAF